MKKICMLIVEGSIIFVSMKFVLLIKYLFHHDFSFMTREVMAILSVCLSATMLPDVISSKIFKNRVLCIFFYYLFFCMHT